MSVFVDREIYTDRFLFSSYKARFPKNAATQSALLQGNSVKVFNSVFLFFLPPAFREEGGTAALTRAP